MQLNTRHTTAKTMPPVARMEKMTVMGIATVTSCSKGTPSFGTRPPEMLGRSGIFFFGGIVSAYLTNSSVDSSLVVWWCMVYMDMLYRSSRDS